MTKTILLIATCLFSAVALSETRNQRTAKEIVNILQSEQVQALLSAENGTGNINGVRYLMSYRAVHGPAIYELSFESNTGPKRQSCTVPVSVNVLTAEVIEVQCAVCEEVK